jgi:tRNA(fMet)-specific endonuclease VapC
MRLSQPFEMKMRCCCPLSLSENSDIVSISRQVNRNEAALANFIRRPFVITVPVSDVTADRYARIASSLRRKGSLIPQNDLWIAAQAMEHGADLFSYDKHFLNVDGLVVVMPNSE